MRSLAKKVCCFVICCGLLGCGGGGQGNNSTPEPSSASNYFALTQDEYGLASPNYLSSDNNASYLSLRGDVVTSAFDSDAKGVIRIDIPQPVPSLSGATYAIEADNPLYEKFPGAIYIFNTQKSTLKRVESGIISFDAGSNATSDIRGNFDVVMTDYDSPRRPAPQYRISGLFGFKVGSSGLTDPVLPPYPVATERIYVERCLSCHPLAGYASSGTEMPLGGEGGRLLQRYDFELPDHGVYPVSEEDLTNLKVFLNLH